MIIYVVSFLLLVAMVAFFYFVYYMFSKKQKVEKEKEVHVPTTQEQLPFEYIRAGIVKLKQNGYRMLVEIPSINLELMEASERQIILEQYKQILTSIDFPFQFLQQSRIVDISDYLTTLEKIKNGAKSKFVRNQLEFYSSYLTDLIKNRSILTKKFYLVIPYDPDKEKKNKKFLSKGKADTTDSSDVLEEEKRFEKASKQLYSRATLIERSFRRFGISPHVLTDDELLELYYTSYNKDRSVYQPLKGKNPADYTTLRVKKDDGRGN